METIVNLDRKTACNIEQISFYRYDKFNAL